MRSRLFALIFSCFFLFCSCSAQSAQTPPSETANPLLEQGGEPTPLPETFYADALISCVKIVDYGEGTAIASRTETRFEYGAFGDLQKEVSVLTDGTVFTDSYEYDEDGNLIRTTRDDGRFTSNLFEYRYDCEGRCIETIDPRGVTEAVVYTEDGSVLRRESGYFPDHPNTVVEYEYHGSAIGYTETTIQYDQNEAGEWFESHRFSRLYRPNGLLSAYKSEAEHYIYTYQIDSTSVEGRSLIKRKTVQSYDTTEPLRELIYSYDARGNLTKVEYVNYHWDQSGVEHPVSLAVEYDELGRLSSYTVWKGPSDPPSRTRVFFEYGKIFVDSSLSGQDLAEYGLNTVLKQYAEL